MKEAHVDAPRVAAVSAIFRALAAYAETDDEDALVMALAQAVGVPLPSVETMQEQELEGVYDLLTCWIQIVRTLAEQIVAQTLYVLEATRPSQAPHADEGGNG